MHEHDIKITVVCFTRWSLTSSVTLVPPPSDVSRITFPMMVWIIFPLSPAPFMQSMRPSHVHGVPGPPTEECHLPNTARMKSLLFGLSLRVAVTYKGMLSSRLAKVSHSAVEWRAREVAILCRPKPCQSFTSISSFHAGTVEYIYVIMYKKSKCILVYTHVDHRSVLVYLWSVCMASVCSALLALLAMARAPVVLCTCPWVASKCMITTRWYC